jgi:hypothetical protein
LRAGDDQARDNRVHIIGIIASIGIPVLVAVAFAILSDKAQHLSVLIGVCAFAQLALVLWLPNKLDKIFGRNHR